MKKQENQRLWSPGWQERIHSKIRSMGFGSVSLFMNAHPGLTYSEAASRISDEVATAQLVMLHLEDGVRDGNFLICAADCFARRIRGHLKRGWGNGVNCEYQTASAMADWQADITCKVIQTELDEATAERVAFALRDIVKPPQGWLPLDGTDPLLRRSFTEVLGESVFQSRR